MKNLCLCLMLLVFAACSNTELAEPTPESGNSYINVTLQNAQTKAGTEVGTTEESKIDHLAFYIFKKSGSLEKKYAFTGADIALGKQYQLTCLNGEKYLYVVANDAALFGKLTLGTQDSVFNKAFTSKQEIAPESPFIMTGKYLNQSTGDVLKLVPNPDNTPSTTPVTVSIARLVGKVTLSTTPVESKFELKSFRVINANPFSNYFKKATSFAEGAVKPDNESAFNTWTDGYFVDNYAPVTVKDAPAYAFENWNSDPRRGNTTAIIIGGIYKGNDTNNTKVTYYRFNLGGKELKWAFNRNTHYKVTITEVYEEGNLTEDGAEENNPGGGKPTDPLIQDVIISATVTIEPWAIVEQSGEIGKE
ncbi:MAG: fimbrial protein [Bacteroidales bacterium]